MNRKIAAILAADVAGYSRLVAADEEGALRRLVEAQGVFKDRVSAYRGRIFNTAGDAILAEFPSAVDATRAALEIQREMAARNAELPPDDRLHFRIGLNIGDVVEHEGDLLGDGVNVAARIQGLAPAGGLAISHWVREHTSGKINVSFRDLGRQALKNIPAPVHVFVAELAPVTSAAATAPMPAAAGGALAIKMVAAGLVLLALGAAAMTQFRSPTPTIAPIETVKPATPQPPQSAPVEQTKAVAPVPAPMPPITTQPPPATEKPATENSATERPIAPVAPSPKALDPQKTSPASIEPARTTPVEPRPPVEVAVPKPLPVPLPDQAAPQPAVPAPSAALPPPSSQPSTPAVSPPVTSPAIDIPRPSPTPPAKSVVAEPPPIKPAPAAPARVERELPLPERRHTCAEVLERAQLGDITPEDRAFLRTQCR